MFNYKKIALKGKTTTTNNVWMKYVTLRYFYYFGQANISMFSLMGAIRNLTN